jgi:hypothetical protein
MVSSAKNKFGLRRVSGWYGAFDGPVSRSDLRTKTVPSFVFNSAKARKAADLPVPGKPTNCGQSVTSR